MFKRTATKKFLTGFLLLFALVMLMLPSSANADAYLKYDISDLHFYNGHRIQVQGYLSNVGDRNATVTQIYIKSIKIWDGNNNSLFTGWLRMSNMSVYVPAGGRVYYEFYVNNLSLPNYDGYKKWRYDYTVNWNRN